MPYIKDRGPIDRRLERLMALNLSEGDLNYIFTRLLLNTKPSCYADHNRNMGVLESCKHEYYRRHVAPYEDEKIKENGDVV